MNKIGENGPQDGELLRAFRIKNDQHAFEELVRRYGRMVHAVAHSVIGHSNQAEDIVQIAFMRLLRKGVKFEDDDSIGGWMHHVALDLARDERLREFRRKKREREVAMVMGDVETDTNSSPSQTAFAVLHEELAKLPELYRESIILHHFVGLSYEEAASRVGCMCKTFSQRISRGRKELRERLIERGIEWGPSALVVALGQGVTTAAFSPEFIAATAKAAKLFAAGKAIPASLISARVVAMAERGLKMLFWAKVKTVTAMCAVAVLVGAVGMGVAVTLPIVLKTAATKAAPNEPLSPDDAWLRELLARAEAGPWDVVNLGTGVYSNDVWRMDARGGPAERRIWNMISGGNDQHQMVIFRDGKRWARGVVVGRMMILPESQAALEVVGAAPATNMAWRTYNYRVTGAPAALQKLQIASVSLTCGPPGQEYSHRCGILHTAECSAGVWYRFAAYFDTETPDGLRSVNAAWPDETMATPQAAAWLSSGNRKFGNNKFELGLEAKGVRMVTQGLKFVPLGADMPLPPKELLERK